MVSLLVHTAASHVPHLCKQQQSAELRSMLPHEPRKVGVRLYVALVANCTQANGVITLEGAIAYVMRHTAPPQLVCAQDAGTVPHMTNQELLGGTSDGSRSSTVEEDWACSAVSPPHPVRIMHEVALHPGGLPLQAEWRPAVVIGVAVTLNRSCLM